MLEVARGKGRRLHLRPDVDHQNWQRNKGDDARDLEAVPEGIVGGRPAQGNDELKAGVNRFIKAYREEGGFEQWLGERYFKEMKDEFKRLGSAFFYS